MTVAILQDLLRSEASKSASAVAQFSQDLPCRVLSRPAEDAVHLTVSSLGAAIRAVVRMLWVKLRDT